MNILVTGAVKWPNEFFEKLETMGHSTKFVQDERISLKDQGIDYCWIEGVICNGLFLYNNIEDFENLKWVHLTSAGYDRVPVDYIKAHQIELYNAKNVYNIPMAEFALSGVLQLYKQAKFFYENQKQHLWQKNRDLTELYGKQICIVGCGSVGTECAKRFKAFGCHVIGVDLYPSPKTEYDEIYEIGQLESVLPLCDVVILTLPLTEKTEHMFDKTKFDLMKQDAVFVNIARGAIVDSNALVNAMQYLKGAVLDVFEEEPLPKESPLWNIEKVILTPHNSFVGGGNIQRLVKLIIENFSA
ncbi:MAG: NAD(P)-dependent oxidoreductase [Lachnoclostridium edouardi]|uniref:NAD(P)-dependent oxidoreductase n=1 Tax=Lachnoclostridium edouardi TaxID=1926283 RepID=UPI0026DC21BD|nr:NAD(P)-dependent oxidoreductase [Lachnoclostridium edouardi]MDO4279944.1 NAD(P)-dependent oxidoreductase [Lachnoclostridium edouardi]